MRGGEERDVKLDVGDRGGEGWRGWVYGDV